MATSEYVFHLPDDDDIFWSLSDDEQLSLMRTGKRQIIHEIADPDEYVLVQAMRGSYQGFAWMEVVDQDAHFLVLSLPW